MNSPVRGKGEFITGRPKGCHVWILGPQGGRMDLSLFTYLCHEKIMPMGSFSLSLVLVGIWAIAVATFFGYILQ